MYRFVVVLLAAVSLASVACGGSAALQGQVDSKTVGGVVESTAYTILSNHPVHGPDAADQRPHILVKDPDYARFFTPADEHAVIAEDMEIELLRKYTDVSYTVNVRLSTDEGGTRPYLVSRDLFKRIRVDGPVRFESSGAPIPTITRLLDSG